MTNLGLLILRSSLLVSSVFSVFLTSAAELDFTRQEFRLPAATESLLVADLNGDGLQELIAVIDSRLQIYFQTESGFDFSDESNKIEFPEQSIGWDLSTRYSTAGSTSIIALIDGKEVLAWQVSEQTIQPPISVKAGLNGYLSKGVNRLHFSRDINGDNIEDFLIPGAGVINLHISDGSRDGSHFNYQPGLSVRSELRLRTNLHEDNLERRTGQSIRIPMMELRDVNSDGFDDLISRTEEALNVFIADNTSVAYFPNQPSYSLDLLEIQQRLGEFDIDNLDFSNLTGLLSLTHEEILDDVDGDGIDDLLLREGTKVSLFVGSKEGMNFSQPRQVLRSGGNILSTFLQDENDDGLKDLWLWRVESISVGDIFVWLALSGSIAIEAFIYPNDGESFARRPSRKVTIDLKFPSVISLASTFRDIEKELKESSSDEKIYSSVADLDANPSAQDLLLMINNQLKIFLNSIQSATLPEEEAELFLGAIDYTREQDNYALNIRELIENVSVGGSRYLNAVADKEADATIELNTEVVLGGIVPVRLNDDERDDVFLFTDTDASYIQGILLLSK